MTVQHLVIPARRRRTERSKPESLEQSLHHALRSLDDAPVATRPVIEGLRALCERGGKRIRGRLCVHAYEGVARRRATRGVYDFAAAIEILHAFMLVHDDLIDRADVRRGGPSVHAALRARLATGAPTGHAEDLAMLGGDLLFALASDAMSTARLPATLARRATSVVLGSARDAAFGECLDVLYESRAAGSLSSGEIAEVLRLKTARYTFEAPLLAGAILARADAATEASLAGFGARLGVAFQLADDLLDLFGDGSVIGKPIGGDIYQRKRTAAMQLTLERATDADRDRLESLLDAGEVADRDVVWAIALVRRTGAAAEMAARIGLLVDVALGSLAGANMDPDVLGELRALAMRVNQSVRELEAAE